MEARLLAHGRALMHKGLSNERLPASGEIVVRTSGVHLRPTSVSTSRWSNANAVHSGPRKRACMKAAGECDQGQSLSGLALDVHR